VSKWFDPFLLIMLAVLLALVFVFIVSCGGPVKGEVVDKWHEDREDNSYWYYDHCLTRTGDPDGSGPQSGGCLGGMRYVYNVDDEDWVLQVQTFKEDGTEGKIKRREVSKDTWYDVEAGDWYDSEAD